MVLMAGMELPVKAIREQVASAIDVIVHQSRLRDGSRKIVSISEVIGMEGDTVTLQDVFVYQPEGYDVNGRIRGKFAATGIRPHLLDKLKENGAVIRDDWFSK
jgi:pilus assembly protein CpaF